MKLFTWIILTCYIILFVLIGAGLIAFSLHWVPVESPLWWLEAAYSDKNLRLACFLAGAGLILLNWMYAELALARFQKQKTIAFENPNGQVTVSLAAIEDFIRRSSAELQDVKELHSDVIARKGKILVRARAVLWSGAHIPEAAERIQSVIKSKVQEMLSGIEEPVIVRVHVAKIALKQEKESPADRRPGQFSPPFRGL
jgi:hypothetical protein